MLHKSLRVTILASEINPWCTGTEALEYFKANNPGAEPLQEGSNEAEWIVDLTTHADRDDMCARSPNSRSLCHRARTRFRAVRLL